MGKSEAAERRDIALSLYGQIVERARRPIFYEQWHVPDTHDGRFEALGLEAALVMRRMRASGTVAQAISQEIFNVMFADMDRSVREQGVGDLSVGKYVKRMASSFLARAQEIDGPLDERDVSRLALLCRRYFHGDVNGAPEMHELAGYLIATDRALGEIDHEPLLRGRYELPGASAANGQKR
ncbi:MAG: ubiquinol-cytochrome C chaperone family protein [Pseudomonadota bacterium]